jgi:hypothetical protein
MPAGTASMRDGVLTDTYMLAPSAIDRSAWCPGRYQVMLSPMPANATLPEVRASNRSFTAAYFQTH